MIIRPYVASDADAVWDILCPMLRDGTTYALPSDWDRAAALAYWTHAGHRVFVAVDGDDVLGTYYLKANQAGAGDRVANCGYVTAAHASGRGVARAMCLHSLEQAASAGFRAMQFNFVASSNERAVRLWTSLGFATVGTIPAAFRHPVKGEVDALVMHRFLDHAKG